MTNAERQAKCAAKKRAEGLTKWCVWIPKAHIETIKRVVAAEVARLKTLEGTHE
jgi:malonyl CoA-acyl carrier protein transacylase